MTSSEGVDDHTDLGFTFRSLKGGEVEILHRGKRAAILRNRKAEKFLTEAAFAEPFAMQQLMARLTGNFKHGNERLARGHGRNEA